MSMSWSRIAVAAVVLLSSVPAVRGNVSLVAEQVAGTTDVELRWEAESAGPFSLLAKTIFPGDQPEDHLPLDPVANLAQAGVTSPLVLGGVADVTDAAHLKLYQVLDQSSGDRSNAGYVLLHDLWSQRDDIVSFPHRTALRDARDVLEAIPQIEAIARRDVDACRYVTFQREPAGGFSGESFPLVATESFIVRATGEAPRIALAGAADPTPQTVVLDHPFSGCTGVFEFVGLPYATTLTLATELLCGEEGVDWSDDNGDGDPDECPAGGWADQPPFPAGGYLSVIRTDPSNVHVDMSVSRNFLNDLSFIGWRYSVMPGHGMAFVKDVGFEPRTFVIPDAGTGAADTCPDADLDGADDASERLFGTDPADAASLPGDRDGDAIRDAEDNCIEAANVTQDDADGDTIGDACDPCADDPMDACDDSDGDGVGRRWDNCPETSNAGQEDIDFDGHGDVCDGCDVTEVFQFNRDGDCLGDWCDPDPDVPTVELVSNVGIAKLMRPDEILIRWDQAPFGFPRGEGHDVVSGAIAHLHEDRGFDRAECIGGGLLVTTRVRDETPGSRWYLVRRSGCPEYRSFGDAGAPGPDPRDALDAGNPCQ